MAILHNRRPIDQTLAAWINNYPESFHPLDMRRFYHFVKTVCAYSRSPKGSDWLRAKLKTTGKYLEAETVDHYCNLFETLQEFHKTPHMTVYESRD